MAGRTICACMHFVYCGSTGCALAAAARQRWYIVLGLSLVWALARHGLLARLYQPLTWQVLFFMAFALGYHLPEITPRWLNRGRSAVGEHYSALHPHTLLPTHTSPL